MRVNGLRVRRAIGGLNCQNDRPSERLLHDGIKFRIVVGSDALAINLGDQLARLDCQRFARRQFIQLGIVFDFRILQAAQLVIRGHSKLDKSLGEALLMLGRDGEMDEFSIAEDIHRNRDAWFEQRGVEAKLGEVPLFFPIERIDVIADAQARAERVSRAADRRPGRAEHESPF